MQVDVASKNGQSRNQCFLQFIPGSELLPACVIQPTVKLSESFLAESSDGAELNLRSEFKMEEEEAVAYDPGFQFLKDALSGPGNRSLMLVQFARKRGWERPMFSFVKTITAAKKSHLACQISLNGIEFTTNGKGISKAKLRQQAAEAFLQYLLARGPERHAAREPCSDQAEVTVKRQLKPLNRRRKRRQRQRRIRNNDG